MNEGNKRIPMTLSEFYNYPREDGYVYEYVWGNLVKSDLKLYGTAKIQKRLVNIIEQYIKTNEDMKEYYVERFRVIKIDDKNVYYPCIAVYKEKDELPVFVAEVVSSPRDLFNSSPEKTMTYRDIGVKEV